jgi:SAM-dependent methyltransferase
MELKHFYEKYWQDIKAAANSDPTIAARQQKLSSFLAGFGKGLAVADVGCGQGDFTAFLAVLGHKPVGIDISSAAVSAAKENHPELRFDIMGPNNVIPLQDGACDAVWSSEVIEHVFDVYEYLSEINRILKPDGMFILTTPYHGRIKNLVIALTKHDTHYDPEISHIRFFDKPGLGRCLNRSGFKPISWSGIGRIWPLYRTWFVVAQKINLPDAPPPIKG